MSRTTSLLALALSLPTFAACGDDPPATPIPDSGTPDVAIDVVLTPDGVAPSDVEAGVVRGPVEVLVTQDIGLLGEGPVNGAIVAFVEADGTTTTVTTGKDGKATANVPAGTSVTAGWPIVFKSTSIHLETVFDVAPNDSIVIGFRPQKTTPINVAIELPPAPVSNVAEYDVSFGCFEATLGLGLTVKTPVQCVDVNGNVHPFAYAKNGSGKIIAVASATKAPTNGAVDFVQPDFVWQTPLPERVVTLGNTAGFDSASVHVFYESGGIGPYVKTVAYPDLSVKAPVPFVRPPTLSTDLECLYFAAGKLDSSGDFMRATGIGCNPAAAGDLATVAQLLPQVSSVTLSTLPPGLPKVEWTLSGSIANGIGIVSSATGQLPADGGSNVFGIWTFIGPPGATVHAPPPMPKEITSLLPNGFVWNSRAVALYEGPSTWAQFRQHPDESARIYDDPTNRSGLFSPPHTGVFRSTRRMPQQQ